MPDAKDCPGTTLVLGVGNVALGDEGFGIHVARGLQQKSGLPGNVRVVAGGVAGFDLLGYLEGVDRLIIVDVMRIELPPGDIGFYELEGMGPVKQDNLSFHQVGIEELLRIAGVIGFTPKVQFLVTKPEKLEWSFELSPGVQQAVAKAVDFLEDRLLREASAGPA